MSDYVPRDVASKVGSSDDSRSFGVVKAEEPPLCLVEAESGEYHFVKQDVLVQLWRTVEPMLKKKTVSPTMIFTLADFLSVKFKATAQSIGRSFQEVIISVEEASPPTASRPFVESASEKDESDAPAEEVEDASTTFATPGSGKRDRSEEEAFRLGDCPFCSMDLAEGVTIGLRSDFRTLYCGMTHDRCKNGCEEPLPFAVQSAVARWKGVEFFSDSFTSSTEMFRIRTTDVMKATQKRAFPVVKRVFHCLDHGCPAQYVQVFRSVMKEGANGQQVVDTGASASDITGLIEERMMHDHNHPLMTERRKMARNRSEAIQKLSKGQSPLQVQIEEAAKGHVISLDALSSLKARMQKKEKEAADLRGDNALITCLAKEGALNFDPSIGVVESALGILPSGRSGFIIQLGGSGCTEFVTHALQHAKKSKGTGPFFHVFIDGKWRFGNISERLQVLMATIVGPATGKGYPVAFVAMDVKSAEDYSLGLSKFADSLRSALTKAGLSSSDVQFHVDGEDALVKVLTQLFPDSSISQCQFHALQCIHWEGVSIFCVAAGFDDQEIREYLVKFCEDYYRKWRLSTSLTEAQKGIEAFFCMWENSACPEDVQATLISLREAVLAKLDPEGHVDLAAQRARQGLTSFLRKVAEGMLRMAQYFHDELLPRAEMLCAFGVGEEQLKDQGTNNYSESQGNRFSKFVGGTNTMTQLTQVIQHGAMYLRASYHIYQKMEVAAFSGGSHDTRKNGKKHNKQEELVADVSIDATLMAPPKTIARMLEETRRQQGAKGTKPPGPILSPSSDLAAFDGNHSVSASSSKSSLSAMQVCMECSKDVADTNKAVFCSSIFHSSDVPRWRHTKHLNGNLADYVGEQPKKGWFCETCSKEAGKPTRK